MKNENTNQNAPLDAWSMTMSILIGLHKAHALALTEYEKRFSEAGMNARGPGVSSAAYLVQTLQEALRSFEPDVRQFARTNGLPLPEIKKVTSA